jgi:hypothetical protein
MDEIYHGVDQKAIEILNVNIHAIHLRGTPGQSLAILANGDLDQEQ